MSSIYEYVYQKEFEKFDFENTTSRGIESLI
jgi:hypothetical protein